MELMEDVQLKAGAELHPEFRKLPPDWEIVPLDALSTVTSGKRLPLGKSVTDHRTSHPYIRVTDMRPGTIDLSDIRYVPDDVFPAIQQYRIFKEDLFISVAGTLGIVGKVPIELDGANLTENANRIGAIKCSQDYLLHVLLSPLIQTTIDSIRTVGAQPKLALTRLRKFDIPLPPTQNEQRAIATALSDADALLSSLEQLIAKKQAIKQGAMQALLTTPGQPGHKRLPGFKGEWEVKRLGEVADIKTGSKNNNDKVEGGLYPFFVRSDDVERINSFSHECEAILVPGEGRIGDIFHYINGRFDVHQRVYAITQFYSGTSARFIHFYLKMFFGGWAMQQTVKATVDSLRLPTFLTFEMVVPPSVAEQTAIATILTDLDAELAALEQQLAKLRLVKQGMMQELLTGRKRLV